MLISGSFPQKQPALPMQLVIELPPREEQLAFNRRRWEEILKDPDLARIPGKVSSARHAPRLGKPQSANPPDPMELIQRLGGHPLPECPISTMDGVRAADVGWFTEKRFAQVQGQLGPSKQLRKSASKCSRPGIPREKWTPRRSSTLTPAPKKSGSVTRRVP